MARITLNRYRSKYTLLLTLILIYVLLPPYFIELVSNYSILDSVISITSVVLMATLIVGYGFEIDVPIILVLAGYGVLVFSSIVNHGTMYTAAINAIFVVMLCIFLQNLIKDRDRLLVFLRIVRNLVFLGFVANLIVSLVYPHGLTSSSIPNLLYGNMNSTVKFMFPGLLCSIILDKYRNKISIYTVVFFLGMIYLNFNIYFMATAFVAMIFIALWMLFMKFINKNAKPFLIIVFALVVLVELFVVLTFAGSSLSVLLTDIFGKVGTFSGRASLWMRVTVAIEKKVWLGYGLQNSEYLRATIGNASGSHNYYLDLIFQRGIVGFILFLLLIFMIFKRIKWKQELTLEQYILLGFVCAYLLMFLMEPFYNTEKFHIPVIYMLLRLLGNNTSLVRVKILGGSRTSVNSFRT